MLCTLTRDNNKLWPVVGLCPRLPAGGDLNNHPELSALRSPRMLVMRLTVLHPSRLLSFKFVGLPFPKIWLVFDHCVNRPGYIHCGSKKNAPTLADYNYDPVQSILIIFSKLFANDHKGCLVVKFSTSPHICCHYTLWNTMLYFAFFLTTV